MLVCKQYNILIKVAIAILVKSIHNGTSYTVYVCLLHFKFKNSRSVITFIKNMIMSIKICCIHTQANSWRKYRCGHQAGNVNPMAVILYQLPRVLFVTGKWCRKAQNYGNKGEGLVDGNILDYVLPTIVDVTNKMNYITRLRTFDLFKIAKPIKELHATHYLLTCTLCI